MGKAPSAVNEYLEAVRRHGRRRAVAFLAARRLRAADLIGWCSAGKSIQRVVHVASGIVARVDADEQYPCFVVVLERHDDAILPSQVLHAQPGQGVGPGQPVAHGGAATGCEVVEEGLVRLAGRTAEGVGLPCGDRCFDDTGFVHRCQAAPRTTRPCPWRISAMLCLRSARSRTASSVSRW